MHTLTDSKILLVEDDPRMCESIQHLLGIYGFEVNTSQTLMDALKALLTIEYDLVLLDLKLGDQSGFAVMDHLIERNLDTRVIVVTGCHSERYAITALKKGAIDYLKKPFEPDELLDAVKRVLERQRKHRELYLFKRIVAISPEAIVVGDRDGRIVYTNTAYEKLMNPQHPLTAPLTTRPLADPAGNDRYDSQIKVTLDTGIPWQGQVELIDDTGRPLMAWKRVDPIPYTIGDRTYGVALMHNMASQLENKALQEKFRNLAELTSDWIWEVDQNGTFTYLNPVVFDLLGYRPEELVGRRPFDLMPPEEARQHEHNFHKTLAKGLPFKAIENNNRHKNGSVVIMETSGVPIFDSAGQAIGYRGINRDISERKRAENKLQEASEKLKTALSKVKRLSGMLPICAACKKIRDDQGYWTELEAFIETHSDAEFSHGICPSCARRLYPELYPE